MMVVQLLVELLQRRQQSQVQPQKERRVGVGLHWQEQVQMQFKLLFVRFWVVKQRSQSTRTKVRQVNKKAVKGDSCDGNRYVVRLQEILLIIFSLYIVKSGQRQRLIKKIHLLISNLNPSQTTDMLDRSDTLNQHLLKYALEADTSPSQQQITQSIRIISQTFPHLDSFAIVQTLYKKLTEIRQSLPIFRILQNRHFDYHQVLKKKIAKIFYHKGYGYQKFRLYLQHSNLSFNIDLRSYNIFCQGIVLQIYRSLQKMMIRNGIKIKFKHKSKVRELNEWVLNYSMFLQERDSQLLREFFAKCYELTDVDFGLKEGKELYELLENRFDMLEDMVMMDECLKGIDLDIQEEKEREEGGKTFQSMLKLQEQAQVTTQWIDVNLFAQS